MGGVLCYFFFGGREWDVLFKELPEWQDKQTGAQGDRQSASQADRRTDGQSSSRATTRAKQD